MLDSDLPQIRKIVSRKFDALADETIKSLRHLSDDSMLSGCDSGLMDVWEEICRQVQTEHSFFWEAYLQVLETAAGKAVTRCDTDLLKIMWLETDGRWDSDNDDEYGDEDDDEDVDKHFSIGDITQQLVDRVLSLAGDYQLEPEECDEEEEDEETDE